MPTNAPSDLYKIGTVAKLTGIAVERLRAWERRYGLVPAGHEGKTRYFSGDQVERLTRIKRLIDQGHPVSTLINLDNDQLSERLQPVSSTTLEPRDSSEPVVGLVGTQLLMLEQMLTQPPRMQVRTRWVNLSVALAELDQARPDQASNPALETAPDVLVILLGSVTPTTLAELDDLPTKTEPVVIYQYATEAGLTEGAERDWELLRWPTSWEDIEAAVERRAKTPLRAGHLAARRFSDEQLLSIATTGSALGCACPVDLVNLISSLNAFSDHSAACASQMDDAEPGTIPLDRATPVRADSLSTGMTFAASRHAQIAQRTSRARLELELVLEEWVIAEGLLPVPN